MNCFDCKVCFGSKFTSSAEGRRFNRLIYDSMTSLFACERFSKSRGLSASVSFLPSPSPHPSFTHSIHRPIILCSRTAQKRLLRRLVNNRRYGRCYVKKYIPPCTFLEFYTHLEADSARSFQNAFYKCSRALNIVFSKTSYI